MSKNDIGEFTTFSSLSPQFRSYFIYHINNVMFIL